MFIKFHQPSDLLPSNVNQDQQLEPEEEKIPPGNVSPYVLVEQMSSLKINEKPKPKPRPNRGRIGFYTSLCSDLTEMEKADGGIPEGKGDKPAHKDKSLKKEKPKKEKRLRGSKYYSALAKDISNMKLEEPDDESQQERKEMKRKNQARRKELVSPESPKKQNVEEGVKDSSDEEPPKWFEKVVSKVISFLRIQYLSIYTEREENDKLHVFVETTIVPSISIHFVHNS